MFLVAYRAVLTHHLFAVEKTVFDQIPELCSPHLHLKWTGFQPAEDPAHPILVNPLYVQLVSFAVASVDYLPPTVRLVNQDFKHFSHRRKRRLSSATLSHTLSRPGICGSSIILILHQTHRVCGAHAPLETLQDLIIFWGDAYRARLDHSGENLALFVKSP